MATYLRLNSVDLNDGTNYRLGRGWRPRVAKRNRSGMGGRLFEDVIEAIPVNIFSKTSLDDCLDARDALIEILEQANRWGLGEDVDPVLFKVKVNGSSLTNPLQAEVIEAGAEDLLQLQPEFNQEIQAWWIQATISLKRRGDLLSDEDSQSPSGVAQPGVVTVTFAESVPLFSPVSLVASNIDYQNDSGLILPKGFWFIASQSDRLLFLEAEDFSTSGATTSTCASIGDANASGAFYAELDHGEDAYWNLGLTDINGSLLGVYAMCRQSSSSAVWQLNIDTYREATSGINANSVTTILTDISYEPVRLALIGRADDDFTLHIQALRLSGSGTFNIDYLVILAMGEPGERAIGWHDMTGVLPYVGSAGTVIDRQMALRNKRLEERRPRFRVELTSDDSLVTHVNYDAEINDVVSIGENLYWIQMAAGASGTWLWLDDGSTTRNLTAIRRRAYLAPR